MTDADKLLEEGERLLYELNWKNRIGRVVERYTNMSDLGEQFLQSQPFFFDRIRMWWMWDIERCCWFQVDETDILNAIDALLPVPNTINNKTKNELIEIMKRVGRKNIPKPIEPTWVQLGGRIYDIKTESFQNARPEYFATNPIPWEYGESEDTPAIDRLFTEWVGEEYVRTLYEILAFCMLSDYPIHRIFCFNGSGCNGKGRFMALLEKFIGKDNCCSSSLDVLVNNRFETSRLHKKLVCLMGETNAGLLSRTDILKRLVGQDQIPFEYKNKNGFTDINYAKIIIATNSMPATTDKTIGYYRRWLIINFPNIFQEGKDVLDTVPDEEYNNLARKCMRILKDLLESGKFTNEGSIEERQRQYEEISNPVAAFLKKYCMEDPDGKITYSEFNRKLKEYIKENRSRKLSKRAIRELLDLENITTERQMEYIDEERRTSVMYVIGVDWKPKESMSSQLPCRDNPSTSVHS